MARDSAGVYTLPNTVNPVVADTPITTDWANTTLGDIETELTNSLDRAGRGAMTQPLQLPDGSAAAPALTFSADTNTGAYRTAADSIGLSTGGTLRLTIASALATAAVPIGAADGAVGAPGLTFSGDLDTGIYRAGANDLRISAGGTAVLGATTAGINFPVAITGALTISGALTINAAVAATAGLTVTQSTANTVGATITGNGTAAGLVVAGGNSNGPGATITPNGSGIGLTVDAGSGTGQALQLTGNSTKAPLKLVSLAGDPSSAALGDVYVTSAGVLKIYTGSAWVVVGTQT